ncbi:MAG: type I pullulanase, partial [Lactobacillus iners]|nr:type I pullulanase [Lactobacillus iners]
GFRFDLMGILDVDTMNQIKRGLNEIDPSILVYGEGWDMRQTNHEIGAGQYNANKLPGISFFSDDFRDSIRGSEFAGVEPGLVFDMDHYGYYRASRMFIAGFLGGKFYSSLSNHPYQSPMQTINYVECHDNYTLFDKLKLLMPNIDEKEIHRRAKLALAMAILAEGIPFINSGQEAFRTKQGDPNSYSSGDQINKIDWNRMSKNKDDVLYLSELLKIRKKYDVFRLDDYSEIEKRIKLLIAGQNGLFAFSYDQNIIVIFNVFNDQKTNLGLDMTGFKKIFSSDADQDCHTVAPLSVNVFVRK